MGLIPSTKIKKDRWMEGSKGGREGGRDKEREREREREREKETEKQRQRLNLVNKPDSQPCVVVCTPLIPVL